MTTKKNEETSLSVASQFTLEQVPTMLEKINAEIAKLKGDNEKSPVINEGLGVFGQIANITDHTVLIDAYSFITRKAAAYEENKGHFEEIEGAKLGDFKEKGHSVKAWKDAIDAQYRKIRFDARLQKLEKAKDLLKENLSKEQKFQQSMADLADLFS